MSTLCAIQRSLSSSRNSGRLKTRHLVTLNRRVVPAANLAATTWRRPCGSSFATTATAKHIESLVVCSKRYSSSISSATSTINTSDMANHSHSTTHLHHHDVTSSSSSSSPEETFSNSYLVLDSPDVILQQHNMTRDDLMTWANQTAPTPLRLADMYKACSGSEQRLRNAQFLHKELPIRTAQRAAELLTLPHGLSNTLAVQQVAATYISHLFKLQAAPVPNTPSKEQAYTQLLQGLILDRASIPMALARGMTSWNESQTASFLDDNDSNNSEKQQRQYQQQQNDVEDALYRFFTARVGLRFLIEHFVLSAPPTSDNLLDTQALQNTTLLFPPQQHDNSNNISSSNNSDDGNLRGCIQSNIDLVREVGKVADLVIQQTMEYYGQCPAIDIVDCVDGNNNNGNDKSQNFCYVPNHLHYIMAELLKNSCRATVRQAMEQQQAATAADNATASVLEQQMKKNKQHKTTSASSSSILLHVPPIRVVIVKGDEDVTIKIADKGGGIPRSRMAKIWRFAHSTADEMEQNSDFGMDTASGARIRGFGLPLARIYSRYFGGELTLKSMEGYGLDAYLHLPRLGDGGENLPLRVRSSPGARDSMPNRLVSSLSSSSSSLRNFSSSTTNNNNSSNDVSNSNNNNSSISNNKKQAATAVAAALNTAITVQQTRGNAAAAAKKKAQWQELSCFWELGYYDPQELLAQEIRQCVLQQQQEKNKLRQYYHTSHAVGAAATKPLSASSSSSAV